ncbi:uncharacterized protein FA14DRAFT_160518 [Meira miltonrushii]|uniref:Serine/threonine-protein kinase Tel1 n=1 Tax=Meira miltonrushii TaxID=1280837 RepID=A0A316VCP9_9BASI|nr:uncharacterized protein FA14DRAFT_160518 [Meira miltonrushii]PWN35316.1 hypothetical protein FA14DRAFT_160518 [Meira miltonrushii]
MLNLQDAVRLISSERATERALGIEQYKQIFNDDETLIRFAEGDDGEKKWLRTLQALFNCVIADRTTCVRRGSWQAAAPASKKRLQDSAGMVLWMIERCNTYLEKQAITSAVNHLTQMIEFRGELVEIVSVYYLKALTIPLSYAPHVDHLEPDLWKFCTNLCFNVILRDHLSNEPDWEDAKFVSTKLYEAPSESTAKPRRTRPDDLEAAKCLYALIRANHAPLVTKERHGVMALYRYSCILYEYPQESSLHLPILKGIVHTLGELSVNDMEAMLQFGEFSWTSLLNLWGSRSQAVKEQVILAFRTLIPVMQQSQKLEFLETLCEEILGEANDRLSIQPIPLTCVDLRSTRDRGPFRYPQFQASNRIDETSLISWSTLELGADLVAFLIEKGSDDSSQPDSHPTPSKRRKLRGRSVAIERGQVLTKVLEPFTGQNRSVSSRTTWHTQLLLFLIARSFDRLKTKAQEEVVLTLVNSLAGADAEVVSWSLVALASATSYPVFKRHASNILQIASRQLLRGAVCRSAAHVLQAIIRYGLIDKSEISATLSTLLPEMELQNVQQVCDATSAFICQALTFLRSNVALTHSSVHVMAFTWFRQAWHKPQISSTQRRTDTLFYEMTSDDVVNLILATSGHADSVSLAESTSIAISCPTTTWLKAYHSREAIEGYVLQGKIDADMQATEMPIHQQEKIDDSELRDPSQNEARGIHHLHFMMRKMETMLEEARSASIALTYEQYQDIVELSLSNLKLQAFYQSRGVKAIQAVTKLAFALLKECISLLRSSQLNSIQKAAIVELLSCSIARTHTEERHHAIQPPGRQAGVHRDRILMTTSPSPKVSVVVKALRSLWTSEDALPVLSSVQEMLAKICNKGDGRDEDQSMNDDFFDGIAQESRFSVNSSQHASDDFKLLAIACLKLLYNASIARTSKDDELERHLESLLNDIPTDLYIESVEVINSCLAESKMFLSSQMQESHIERIGSDVLATYAFERNIEGQTVVIEFLRDTMSSWLTMSSLTSKRSDRHIQLCQFFMRQFNKNHLHWTVECAFARLMEQLIRRIVVKEGLEECLPKLLRPQAVIKSLCTLNGRSDMRARFPSSSLLGRLFDLWGTHFGQTKELYEHQEATLPVCREDQSQMASRILTLANICVASALVRPYSFFHLLEVCIITGPHSAHGSSTLQNVSHLLGYADRTRLWISFAAQLVCAMIFKDYLLDQAPIHVLGFKSQKEWATSTYKVAVPPLLNKEGPAYEEGFSKLSKFLDTGKREVVLTCLPSIIAYKGVEYVCTGDETPNVREYLASWAESNTKVEKPKRLVDTCLVNSLDVIVVQILQRWHESEKEHMDLQIATSFPRFSKLVSSLPFQKKNLHLLELAEPCVGTKQLLNLLASISSSKLSAISAEVAFNVLNQLGSILYDEQSLDNQLRLLLALHVYVSMTWSMICDSPILIRSLLQVCLACLDIQDLVEQVAPILCLCISNLTEDVEDFAATLVIVCEKLLTHSQSKDTEIEAISIAVMDHVEKIAIQLYDSETMRSGIRSAFCAWPRELPMSVAHLQSSDLPALMRAVHEVNHINVHFLRRFTIALKGKEAERRAHFASTVLWKILELLQSSKNTSEEEMNQFMAALADITFQCDGMLPSPSVKALRDPGESDSLLRYVRQMASVDEKTEDKVLPLQRWLTEFLLQKVHSLNLCEAQDAACTLRNIFKQDPQFNGFKRQKDHQSKLITELRYVVAFEPQRTTSIVAMDILLAGDEAHQKATDLNVWSRWLCLQLFHLLDELDNSLPYMHLGNLVKEYEGIAQGILPCIVHVFFRIAKGKKNEKSRKAMSHHFMDILRYEKASPEVWKLIIEIVLQLREDPPSSIPFSGDGWIHKVDWLLLASRSVQVQLFASALLFLEVHNQSSSRPENASSVDLQYAIYSNIEDPDSFYGIHNDNVRDSLRRRLEHEGRWEGVFSLQAAEFETSNAAKMRQNIVSTLHQMRYDRVALEIRVEEDQIDYEIGWRTQNWDLPMQASVEMVSPSQALYSALRSLHENRNAQFVQSTISTAFASHFKDLKKINVESSKVSQRILRDLIGLREIQSKEDEQDLYKHSLMDFDVFESWMSIKCSLLQAERKRTLPQALGEVNLDESDENIASEISILLSLSQRAREEDKTQIAINAVIQAQNLSLQHSISEHKYKVDEEFAKVLWMQGNHSIAADALSTLLQSMQNERPASVQRERAQSLSTLGQWRVTARSHHAHVVVRECFRPALGLLESIKAFQEAAEVAYRYGVFADEQYRELCTSNEGRRLEKMINDRHNEIGLLDAELAKYGAHARGPKITALKNALTKATVILQADDAALSEHNKSKDKFRRDAVEMFVRELSSSGQINDDALMRLTSLWFENSRNEPFNQKLAPLIKRIPSWKFIPMVRQICSRLSKDSSMAQQGTSRSSSSAFQSTVFDIVLNMAKDHPFHAWYPLYALSRGSREAEQDSHSRRRMQRVSSGTHPSATQTERGDVASDIINRVRIGSKHKERIQALYSVCEACVEWARFDLEEKMPKEFGPKRSEKSAKGNSDGPRIPQHLQIHKIRDVNIPIVTKSLPIEPNASYTSFVRIAHYADHFKTAGGIHLPKITDCTGSDGKRYKQLFKNNDDLRQDAVMQQVFTLVNSMLKQDRRASKRSLHVRTYSVVPLGPQYGLLEFVPNTVPLLAPLQHTYKLHREDGRMTPTEAREKIAKLAKDKVSIEERRKGFEEVCERMPPVFRFYFLHLYTNPLALLQSRLNYTRTVATSSIVGHILGLGDRHSSNILLDQENGEVIHIDFGVAFDQGKLLPIPELVPFRLTQNVIDGMGLNGVEGVFRHGCQETLRVLRGGASVIKTVLEVFKNDPLYDWTQSPVKVLRAQGYDDDDESLEESRRTSAATSTTSGMNGRGTEGAGQSKEVAELAAERAINSTMEKLSNNLSVEYTVNALMTRAMDSTNLATIFHGWQAAL